MTAACSSVGGEWQDPDGDASEFVQGLARLACAEAYIASAEKAGVA
jgi:hypothetical protein